MIAAIKRTLRRIIRPPLHKPDIKIPHVVLGTEYGGWPLVARALPSNPLVYSFGIGEDISFDRLAIERFQCRVIGFDPTPRSRLWLEQQDLPDSFTFDPIGLAASDGVAEFFAPANHGYVSFSATPAIDSDPELKISADVLRLETIIERHGGIIPDVLKMDIEGFEYDVIDDILKGTVRPSHILVEFHHNMYGIEKEKTNESVIKLKENGYSLFYVSSSGHEYGFILNN